MDRRRVNNNPKQKKKSKARIVHVISMCLYGLTVESVVTPRLMLNFTRKIKSRPVTDLRKLAKSCDSGYCSSVR